MHRFLEYTGVYFSILFIISTGIAASEATMAAARKTEYGGTKSAPLSPIASSPIKSDIMGPIIMGISTMKHMRTP